MKRGECKTGYRAVEREREREGSERVRNWFSNVEN